MFLSSTIKGQYSYDVNENGAYYQIISESNLRAEILKQASKQSNPVIDDNYVIYTGMTDQLIYKNMGLDDNGGHFSYDYKAEFKDGRTRLTIENIKYHKGRILLKEGADLSEEYPHNWTKVGKNKLLKEWKRMKEQADKYFNSLMTISDSSDW